jgi:plastocyanin
MQTSFFFVFFTFLQLGIALNQTVVISMARTLVTPKTVEIQQGDQVTFVVVGNDRIQVIQAGSTTSCAQDGFQTRPFDQNRSSTVVFTSRTGMFHYTVVNHCPQLSGSIKVYPKALQALDESAPALSSASSMNPLLNLLGFMILC